MAQPLRSHDLVSEECLVLTAELQEARLQVLKLRRSLAAAGPHQSSVARSLDNWLSIQASRSARLRLFAQRHGLSESARLERGAWQESLIRIRA
jgi:hypothetical protein